MWCEIGKSPDILVRQFRMVIGKISSTVHKCVKNLPDPDALVHAGTPKIIKKQCLKFLIKYPLAFCSSDIVPWTFSRDTWIERNWFKLFGGPGPYIILVKRVFFSVGPCQVIGYMLLSFQKFSHDLGSARVFKVENHDWKCVCFSNENLAVLKSIAPFVEIDTVFYISLTSISLVVLLEPTWQNSPSFSLPYLIVGAVGFAKGFDLLLSENYCSF